MPAANEMTAVPPSPTPTPTPILLLKDGAVELDGSEGWTVGAAAAAIEELDMTMVAEEEGVICEA